MKTMTTTEDLYQQAETLWSENRGFGRKYLTGEAVRDLHAVVDLVLDARLDRQPWEVLREAANIMHPKSHPTGMWTSEERALRDEAKRLEAEHHAAQEKAAAEAEREKLIEQARGVASEVADDDWTDDDLARAFVDAGWRPAPESDGGAA